MEGICGDSEAVTSVHHLTLLGSDGEQNLGQTSPLELTEYLAGGVSTFGEQWGPKRDGEAHREGRSLASFKMEMWHFRANLTLIRVPAAE